MSRPPNALKPMRWFAYAQPLQAYVGSLQLRARFSRPVSIKER